MQGCVQWGHLDASEKGLLREQRGKFRIQEGQCQREREKAAWDRGSWTSADRQEAEH